MMVFKLLSTETLSEKRMKKCGKSVCTAHQRVGPFVSEVHPEFVTLWMQRREKRWRTDRKQICSNKPLCREKLPPSQKPCIKMTPTKHEDNTAISLNTF